MPMCSRKSGAMGGFLRFDEPYVVVASHGPFRSQYGGLNYVMNTMLSFHMVIAFIVAVILDNTVPGSKQEREVYVWSEAEAARREPVVVKDYRLPFCLSIFSSG
nr:nucleobase-ascorbate transporter 12 [Tanacetum cinerariifolium]